MIYVLLEFIIRYYLWIQWSNTI